MKANLSLLNSLGFQNASQKALFAASQLDAAITSSPAIQVRAATPFVIARAEVIAQTSKPARAATNAILGTANTVGYTFGELYLNSPAYPIGTAIPAIPAKAASLAVPGIAAIAAVPGVPAILSPAVVALKGWDMAVDITKTASNISIEAYLPVAQSPKLIGAVNTSIDAIGEITPTGLVNTIWLDAKASNTPETLATEVNTMEKYLYKQALALVAAFPLTNTIHDVIYVAGGVPTACKKISLSMPCLNHDSTSLSLQLSTLGTPVSLPT